MLIFVVGHKHALEELEELNGWSYQNSFRWDDHGMTIGDDLGMVSDKFTTLISWIGLRENLID